MSYNIKEYSQAIIKHYFRLLVLENTLSFTKSSFNMYISRVYEGKYLHCLLNESIACQCFL